MMDNEMTLEAALMSSEDEEEPQPRALKPSSG